MTQQQNFQAEYLSPRQVGQLIGVSAKTVIRAIEAGELTGQKFGGQWRVAVSEYERWSKRD